VKIRLDACLYDMTKVTLEFSETPAGKFSMDLNLDLDVAEKLALDLMKHVSQQRVVLAQEVNANHGT
jgi:hypothetical protein